MSLARVYDAFIDAGASREAATAATEALEAFYAEDDPCKWRVESGIKDLHADIQILKWMVAANIALNSAIGIGLLRLLVMQG